VSSSRSLHHGQRALMSGDVQRVPGSASPGSFRISFVCSPSPFFSSLPLFFFSFSFFSLLFPRFFRGPEKALSRILSRATHEKSRGRGIRIPPTDAFPGSGERKNGGPLDSAGGAPDRSSTNGLDGGARGATGRRAGQFSHLRTLRAVRKRALPQGRRQRYSSQGALKGEARSGSATPCPAEMRDGGSHVAGGGEQNIF